jgi:signal transduction histidine kinase
VEARLHRDHQGSTATALRTIETTGREALAELRRLLGLLRSDEGTGEPLLPLPSLRNLDGLLGEVRQAGLRVSGHISGQPRDLAPGIDLSIYRVLQEALTNALKHAPGATVTVHVDYLDDSVTVAVEDDGARRQSFPAPPGSGQGLIGMQERVKLYDGHLEAGPSDSGGFTVRASIPAPADQP